MKRGLPSFAATTAALFTLSSAMAQPAKTFKLPGDNCEFADAQGNLLPAKATTYILHQKYDIYRKFDIDCNGHLSESESAAFEASMKGQLDIVRSTVESAAAAGRPIRLEADGKSSRVLFIDPKPPADDKKSGWSFLLRDSAEDIGIYLHPKDFKSAGGAQAGYSNDAAAGNVSWSAKGVATVVYQWLNDDPNSSLVGFALAPWVSFNRLTNSNAAASFQSKQLDVLSFGGSSEIGLGPTFLGDQYLRIKGALNTNFEFDPQSWSATAEWQPFSNKLGLSAPIFIPHLPLTVEIDPILRGQILQRINGSTLPVFSQHDQLWRGGPAVGLTIKPKKDEIGDIQDGFLPKWLQPSGFNLSYGALFDTYTGKEYYLLNTSLTFPLDEQGHIGLKFSYQRGQNEETGIWVDQAMIGLGVKW